jgi:predicted ester cyclase
MEEIWNNGNPRRLHVLYPLVDQSGRPTVAATVLSGLRSALPDMRLEITQTVTARGCVVAEWTVRGTHTGEVAALSLEDVFADRHIGADNPFGFLTLSPSGRHVQLRGISTFRLQAGKVVSNAELVDRLEVVRQLRGLPLPDLRAA